MKKPAFKLCYQFGVRHYVLRFDSGVAVPIYLVAVLFDSIINLVSQEIMRTQVTYLTFEILWYLFLYVDKFVTGHSLYVYSIQWCTKFKAVCFILYSSRYKGLVNFFWLCNQTFLSQQFVMSSLFLTVLPQ